MISSISKRFLSRTSPQSFGKWGTYSTLINEGIRNPEKRQDDNQEVEYGITKGEFRTRRRKLIRRIVQKPFEPKINFNFDIKNARDVGEEKISRHLVVIPTSERHYMVEKIPYFYRPGTDFRYLTGNKAMNAVLVLEVEVDPQDCDQFEYKSILFVQNQDPRSEKWEGRPMERSEALERFGVDEVNYVDGLPSYFKNLQSGQSSILKGESSSFIVWYEYQSPTNNQIQDQVTEMLKDGHVRGFRSPKQALHDIRVIKSPSEIQLMRETCRIASESIKETIERTKDLNCEAEAFATVDYLCRMKGADYLAYPPVVAAGDHANTIHYTLNTHDPLNRKDLMLMDAGCEYGGYTSDVTRTWPLCGKFELEMHRMVYDAVFEVQAGLIRMLESGSGRDGLPITIDSLYHEMQRLFRPHLVDLGLLTNDMDDVEANCIISEVCPHHVSHYLGMDVHDTPLVSRNVPLVPGMTITLEPGLYFPIVRPLKHVKSLPEELKGVGVRLEDDLLITSKDGKTTCEVLSNGCPKSRKELEDLIK